jgi:hypothetical protein
MAAGQLRVAHGIAQNHDWIAEQHSPQWRNDAIPGLGRIATQCVDLNASSAAHSGVGSESLRVRSATAR